MKHLQTYDGILICQVRFSVEKLFVVYCIIAHYT